MRHRQWQNFSVVRAQVIPLRIVLFDEPQFPRPIPFLDGFLAPDCFEHIIYAFIVDENVKMIALGETIANFVLCSRVRRERSLAKPVYSTPLGLFVRIQMKKVLGMIVLIRQFRVRQPNVLKDLSPL